MKRTRIVTALTAAACAMSTLVASPAIANTRDNAHSYINSRTNINTVPGSPGWFWANSGVGVWMDCWTRGPLAAGQYKWFKVTVREGTGYGVQGYVPAPRVSNQWTSSPLCPPW